MYFIAEELREILASLGLETVEELVGRTDLLQRSTQLKPNSKKASLQIERLIEQFDGVNTKEISQNHHLDEGFDLNYLYPDARYSIENGHSFTGNYVVNNEQRDVGVITGSAIAKQYGEEGLPEDTILAYTEGHAGQSLAAYAPRGLTIHHTGDANDYVGKGLSGGTVIVNAPNSQRENEIIAGNVNFYGASRGKAFINGKAGERFCIRNSGADVVVEGIGDHGLEYDRGHVIILGDVGKNFGQGMSGGVSYIFLLTWRNLKRLMRLKLWNSVAYVLMRKNLLSKTCLKHILSIRSNKARQLLDQFDNIEKLAIKVIPKDYKLMMQKLI